MNENEMKQMGTGSVQSPEDYRYVNVEHLAGAAPEASAFPANFHIDFSSVPDLNQRQIGACTCHACVEMRIKREFRITGGHVRHYSPRFTYALAKINDGLADKTNQGTFPVMPLKMGVKFGFATETTVPNDTTLSFDEYIYHRDITKMPKASFDEASFNKIPGYAQVGSFNNVSESQLKQALQQSQDGVSVTLQVGNEWWTAADGRTSWASADILPIRRVVTPVSGHDITATGWETEEGTGRCKVFFRNHWSTQWADNDNGWFYFDQHTITEAWIISEIPDKLRAILQSLPAQADFSHRWNVDMPVGSQGPDVQALQIALKIVGTFPFLQPTSTYFGNVTKQAVIDFQKEYTVTTPEKIAQAGGAVGPITRKFLNQLFAR